MTSLVKKVDQITNKNADALMGSAAIFCSDDEKLEKKLRDLADKEKIGSTVLAIEEPNGPDGYKLAKTADIMVIFYLQKKVVANHVFKKGQLTEKGIEKMLEDVKKLFPNK